jgi:hypothetical protein
MNAERIRQLAADEDLQAVFREIRASLTRKVMAATTSDEDRAKALADFHALGRVETTLTAWGQKTTKE